MTFRPAGTVTFSMYSVNSGSSTIAAGKRTGSLNSLPSVKLFVFFLLQVFRLLNYGFRVKAGPYNNFFNFYKIKLKPHILRPNTTDFMKMGAE